MMRGRRILAIGAHPDDLTLGCFGTLLKLRENNDISVLIMSGAGTVQQEEAEIALDDITDDFRIYDFPPTRFPSANVDVAIIDRAIEQSRIDTVITHARWDTHQDHATVEKMTLAACRRRPITMLAFHAISSTPRFEVNLTVDISEQFEAKLKATQCHRSQAHKRYFNEDYLRAWHHDKRATAAGLRLVELFHVFHDWWR